MLNKKVVVAFLSEYKRLPCEKKYNKEISRTINCRLKGSGFEKICDEHVTSQKTIKNATNNSNYLNIPTKRQFKNTKNLLRKIEF